jgi:hypothetical protein
VDSTQTTETLKMKYKFYVTNWQPNGLSDLIITDEYGQIIESINDALFGPKIFVEADDRVLINYYGESIAPMRKSENDEATQELIDAVLDGQCHDLCPVYRTNDYPDYLRGKIAISPIDDGAETLAILNKYLID